MLGLIFLSIWSCIVFSNPELPDSRGFKKNTELDSLLVRANNYFYHRQFDSAIICYKEIINSGQIDTAERTNIAVRLAHAYMSHGSVDSAKLLIRSLGTEAYSFEGQESILHAEINYIKGHLHYIFSEIDSARFHLNIANDICTRTGNDSLPTLIMKDFGNIAFASNEYAEALYHYEKALEFEKGRLIPSELVISSLYQNISIIYAKKFEYSNANRYFRNSLEIKEKILSTDDILLIHAYINYSLLLTEIGNFQEALEFSNRAEQLVLSKFSNDHYLLGHIYHDRSLTLENLGETEKAKVYVDKAYEIYLIHYDQNYSGYSHLYWYLGSYYYKQGDYKRAIYYLNKVDFKIVDSRLKILTNLILANSVDNSDFKFKSSYYFDECQKTINQMKMENTIVASLFYSSYGKYLESLGEIRLAEEFLSKSIDIGQCSNINTNDFLYCINNIGNFYLSRGRYFDALDYFNKGINYYISKNHPKQNNKFFEDLAIIGDLSLILAFEGKGRSYFNMYLQNNSSTIELDSSIYYFNIAIKLLNNYRVTNNHTIPLFKVSNEEINSLFDFSIYANFELYNNLSTINNLENVFRQFELSKANKLRININSCDAVKFSNIPQDNIIKENDMRMEINYLSHKITSLHSKSKDDEHFLLPVLKSLHFDALIKYDSLITFLEKQYPDYYALKYEVNSPSLESIQQKLNESSALVDYSVFDTNIYIVVITKDSIHLKKTSIEKSFKAIAMNYFRAIKTAAPKKEILEDSYKLFSVLIKPIYEIIGNKEDLIIIPDSYLYYIPFETLVSQPPAQTNLIAFSEMSYLIREHSFSYHYSAALWEKGIESSKNNFPKCIDHKFIGFAPVFNNNGDSYNFSLPAGNKTSKNHLRSPGYSEKTFTFLPYSKLEVESISNLFKEKNLKYCSLINDQATEKMFKEQVHDYSIIHVATHAFSNDEEPELSGMVFSTFSPKNGNPILSSSNSKIGAYHDSNDSNEGILYAGEMYNLDMDADLIVLSACETGVGKLVKGEGMIAMTRGLIYSGANNVLYTLWKISDKHTQTFMIDFYSKILEGKSYPQALRFAKLQMLEKNSTAYPKLWGGYMLIGQ